MRVICTGISGTERMTFFEAVARRARARDRELRIFDVRDVMFQIARDVGEPVDEETVLDMFPRALVLLRAAALEKIAGLVEGAGRDQDWIINTHAVFRWKNTLVSGFDPYYLRRLRPDLYITVTSGVLTVRDRLRRFPRWEKATVEELLVWREEEQWATEEMARIHHKPQLLWPRTMTPESLARLMFEPKLKTAYLSYPMQHAIEGGERGLARFKARLERLLLVFDPADVNDFVVEERPAAGRAGTASRANGAAREPRDGDAPADRNGSPAAVATSDGSRELAKALALAAGRMQPTPARASSPRRTGDLDGPSASGASDTASILEAPSGLDAADAVAADLARDDVPSSFTDRELQHIGDQIVVRDYKLIAQADMVIVFYDAMVPSPGVISEMNYALQMGKRVYGVWLPENEPSPFFTRYCTRCFRSEDELFRYFERYRIAGAASQPARAT